MHSAKRNRFVKSFFIAGAMVPLVLMTFGRLAGTLSAADITPGHTTLAQWAFLWIIWPTWILMLDAEHAGTIVFMLLLSSALNGLWYAGLSFISWHVVEGVKGLITGTVRPS
jgi:hypothetical protein